MRMLKILTVFSGLLSIIIVISIFFENEILMNLANPLLWPSNVSCYFLRSHGILELGSGEWDEAMLIPARCIFFLETGCFDSLGTGYAVLDRRRACAVEAAAKINPSMNIFLLFLTPKKFTKKSSAYVKKLESYNNVYVRRVRLASYFEETPVKDWYSKNVGKILGSEEARKSIFEIVRLVTMWKYGGIFVDLDLILATSLEELTNIAVKGKTRGDSPVMLGVDISSSLGKRFADFTLNEINRRTETTLNTTSMIEKFCDYTSVELKDNIDGFTIFSSVEKFSQNNCTNKYCPRIYG